MSVKPFLQTFNVTSLCSCDLTHTGLICNRWFHALLLATSLSKTFKNTCSVFQFIQEKSHSCGNAEVNMKLH